MTLKQRARTGLKAGLSTVTELQHPAGSPEGEQPMVATIAHRPAQCRRACNSERPTSGATDGSAIPEWMPNYGFGFIPSEGDDGGTRGSLLLRRPMGSAPIVLTADSALGKAIIRFKSFNGPVPKSHRPPGNPPVTHII